MKKFKGVSASVGIGMGSAYILQQDIPLDIPRFTIRLSEQHESWQRFLDAVEQVQKDLSFLTDNENNEQRAIFSTYSLMLSDPEFILLIQQKFESSSLNIEYIVHTEVESFIDQLAHSGDRYLAERANDIKDVFDRVLNCLLEKKTTDFNDIPLGAVLIANTLKPSDAVVLRERRLSGLVLQEGGINSHVAILARSYTVPTVMGVPDILESDIQDCEVIVDGTMGLIIVNPDEQTKISYTQMDSVEKEKNEHLSSFRMMEAHTACGKKIEVFANIGVPEDTALALSEGAKGIGLFRSEFLFIREDSLIGEEEQFSAYKTVLCDMQGMNVTIRTLDAGADKLIRGQDISSDANPLLGWRAVRFCFDRRDIFKTQLRALFRAGVYGNLKIMFPFISDAGEIDTILLIIDEVKTELSAEGYAFNHDIPLGIMIETPAAAVISDILAKKVSFFSIGSNDLTQYTIAVDRENKRVARLYNEYHPAVLRLIKQTIDSAYAAGISVSLCGEMASHRESSVLLLGLGLRTFSLSASGISALKEILSLFTVAEAQVIANKALCMESGDKIQEFVLQEIQKKHE